MSWPLADWQAEAERLGGRFWQSLHGPRRIARAYFGGNSYVEVALFQDRDLINSLITPRIAISDGASLEIRAAAAALSRWTP